MQFSCVGREIGSAPGQLPLRPVPSSSDRPVVCRARARPVHVRAGARRLRRGASAPSSRALTGRCPRRAPFERPTLEHACSSCTISTVARVGCHVSPMTRRSDFSFSFAEHRLLRGRAARRQLARHAAVRLADADLQSARQFDRLQRSGTLSRGFSRVVRSCRAGASR